MKRTMQRKFQWTVAVAAISAGSLIPQIAHAVNSVVWESGNSLVNTTNYAGVAPFYWFANFDNPAAVTGAAMNDHEARNLPNWIKLESQPSCIGKDDGCVAGDSTIRTGFSFAENAAGTIGATSIGGQATYNTLTLPNATSGISGLAGDQLNVSSSSGNTSSMLQMRILPGAPNSFRMWVVTDNGAGANFHPQARMRVSLRNTVGPPAFGGDSDTSEAEALPGGARLIATGSDPNANNGVADAWAFRLSDVGVDDIVTVRPTSAVANALPGFAGIMIQVIPEPSSVVLLTLGFIAVGVQSRRQRN